MYIKRIRLSNIRGFRHLDFPLSRGPGQSYAGWTVFTGDNGSGKSSLLKAVAVALSGKDTARSLQPTFERWISSGEKQAVMEVELAVDPDEDRFASSGKLPKGDFVAGLHLKANHREPIAENFCTVDGKNAKSAERGLWSPAAEGWFSCGYGPFRRVFGASSEAQRLMSSTATERFVTMFREDASLAEVDVWLRDLQHKKLEKKPDAERTLDGVLSLLRDELMPNQLLLDRVDSEGVWLKDRKGIELSWGDMSDGYRAALALMGDILRHLIAAYGIEGLFEDVDGHVVCRRGGVVLIDEIDAHLHPEWQREIGFWFKRHFPRLQFIVTSHSPIICQAADTKGLFHLPEPGSEDEPRQLSDEEYNTIIASRPDTILRSAAFGLENTRSPRAVDARARYALLMSKKRAGGKLTPGEKKEAEQTELFANADGE